MINIKNKSECSGCKACYSICPKGCIDMISDNEGFWYPEVDISACIECGQCVKVCPEINICANKDAVDKPETMAAWNKDSSNRKNSSSGGVFSALSEDIISRGGVVFGAVYDEKFKVVHGEAESVEALEGLRGSKYVQSDIGDSYSRAKACLLEKREVLFSGTPCQIAGLYNYLGKEYENLYTCDFICHGVPSPEVFESYKSMMEERYKSSIEKLSFRSKEQGWKLFSMSMQFSDGSKYSKTLEEDPFMIGFLKDYYLRPSCHSCSYAKLPRVSDITLGDYWGVSGKYPELDDDKGTSLLLVNTEKGKNSLERCRESLVLHRCELNHAIAGNPCIVRPVKAPEARMSFFEDFNSQEFGNVVEKYMSPPSWINRKITSARRKLGSVKRVLRNMNR